VDSSGSSVSDSTRPQIVVGWAQLNTLHASWSEAYETTVQSLQRLGQNIIAPEDVPVAADLLIVAFRGSTFSGQQGLLAAMGRMSDVLGCASRTAYVVQCGPSVPPAQEDEIAGLADMLQASKRRMFEQFVYADQFSMALPRWISYLRKDSGLRDAGPRGGSEGEGEVFVP
jgi:hypothetical protein